MKHHTERDGTEDPRKVQGCGRGGKLVRRGEGQKKEDEWQERAKWYESAGIGELNMEEGD